MVLLPQVGVPGARNARQDRAARRTPPVSGRARLAVATLVLSLDIARRVPADYPLHSPRLRKHSRRSRVPDETGCHGTARQLTAIHLTILGSPNWTSPVREAGGF